MESKELIAVNEKVGEIRRESIAIVARATNLQVKDAISNQRASGILGEVVSLKKQAVEERLAFTRPLDHVKKMIMGKYAPIVEQFGKAEDIIKDKMRDYFILEQEKTRLAEQKRQEREEEIRKAAEALLAKGKSEEAEKVIAEIPVAEPPPEINKTTHSIQGHTTTMRVHKTFRIIDESKVPAHFKIISETLIQKAVNAGAVLTPEEHGIEIYDDIQPSTRTAK